MKRPRITGTIKRKVANGWWVIEDSTGQRSRVAGNGDYRVGTEVAVVAGQIVGTSGKRPTATVYQV